MSPSLVMCTCPRLGLFICHDGGSFAFGRLGHPGLSPKGSWLEWQGECHGSRTVLSECFGPPEWKCEARDPWCGYSLLTSAECILNLSIVVPADKGLVRVGHTMSQQ